MGVSHGCRGLWLCPSTLQRHVQQPKDQRKRYQRKNSHHIELGVRLYVHADRSRLGDPSCVFWEGPIQGHAVRVSVESQLDMPSSLEQPWLATMDLSGHLVPPRYPDSSECTRADA